MRYRIRRAWWGTNRPRAVRPQDWAVLELEDALGEKYGFFGIDTSLPKIVNIAGYSADFEEGRSLSAHVNCRIHEDKDNQLWIHDCDVTRGSSGAPIFVRRGDSYLIVGVHAAERRQGEKESLILPAFEAAFANLGVKSIAFRDAVESIVKSGDWKPPKLKND